MKSGARTFRKSRNDNSSFKMATENEDKRSDDEKKLFELIEKGPNEAVIAHVKATKVKVDCLDPKGMTPLQYAAFRGNKEICEFLLANGADVNSNYHENSYSALMFAALSGNKEVTRLMLEAGANVNHVNSVNRTASQMAAFVGQHQCVSVINNFFPREEINYYTKPQGLEKEAKLPEAVAPSLCTLINFTNLHPVKISLFLRDHPQILNEHKKVCIVLSRLVEKNMKSRETNDVLAMKCHFVSSVIKLAAEAREKDKERSLNSWIKTLMKGRDEDGFLEFQERLIRQSLKEFPYSSSALLQQLVRQIAPVKIGNEPTALSLLVAAMNGQQFAWEAAEGCDTCGEPKAKSKCSKCKMVVYCSQDCQRLHWSTHKKLCDKLAEQFRKQEERRKKEEEKQRQEEEKQRQEEERRKKEEESQNDGEGEDKPVSETDSKVDPADGEKVDNYQHLQDNQQQQANIETVQNQQQANIETVQNQQQQLLSGLSDADSKVNDDKLEDTVVITDGVKAIKIENEGKEEKTKLHVDDSTGKGQEYVKES